MGHREGLLRQALDLLAGPGLRLLRISNLYETEPVGLAGQPWFLNLVAEFETDLPPLELLQRAQQAELALGRTRTIPNGPRTVDIDILLYGPLVMETEALTIPHPRYHERRFVLAPLAELKPQLRDPRTGTTVEELLHGLQGQAVTLRLERNP